MICSSSSTRKREIIASDIFRRRNNAKALRCEIASSLDDILYDTWNLLAAGASPFLQIEYLSSLSNNLPESDKCWFCLVYRGEDLVGIAVFHLTSFEADQFSANLSSNTVGNLMRRSFNASESAIRVLLCGNAYATGVHGFRFSDDLTPPESMDALCYALTDILRAEERAGTPIHAVLAKDFFAHTQLLVRALRKCGFREFESDPAMIVPIHPSWQTFSDYLNAMNSKFRTKANSALKRSAILKRKMLNAHEIAQWEMELFELYSQVLGRADFKLGKISSSALAALLQSKTLSTGVAGYFLEDTLVGFTVHAENNCGLEAHLVGIDYTVNSQFAIYPRMLYDFIDTAIQLQKEWVSFGRTAGEIKSSVGAFPVPLTCCVRHPGKLPNFLLRMIVAFVKPAEFPVRNPWKNSILPDLKSTLQKNNFFS